MAVSAGRACMRSLLFFEREESIVEEGQRKRERKIPSRLLIEPNVGLDLTNCEIMT